jgi:fucose permease
MQHYTPTRIYTHNMTDKRHITTTFFIAFLILGLALPLVGVTLGDLTARFGMPLEDGGLFNVVGASGMMIASVGVGRLYDRLNARTILPVGVALVAAAMFGFFLAPTRLVGFASVFLLGFGFGAYMIGPNILVARLNPGRATGPLNAINLAFGIGAIASPQLVTLSAFLGEIRLAYLFSGIPVALLIIPLALVNLDPPPVPEDSTPQVKLSLAALFPFAVLFFCAMGVEVGFNSWIVTQLEKAANATQSTANFGASMFWIGYAASRTGSTWLGQKIRAEQLLIGSSAPLLRELGSGRSTPPTCL